MASSNRTRDNAATHGLGSVQFLLEWLEYLAPVAPIFAFGALVVALAGGATLALITISPVAASVVGTAGLLVVWLAGIGFIVATPRLAMYCVLALERAL